jgi:hypothetical protein
VEGFAQRFVSAQRLTRLHNESGLRGRRLQQVFQLSAERINEPQKHGESRGFRLV